MKKADGAVFTFTAHNESTLEAFRQELNSIRPADRSVLNRAVFSEDALTLRWTLSGREDAGELVWILFDALVPLQQRYTDPGSDVNFSADWRVSDSDGIGRGHMPRLADRVHRVTSLLTRRDSSKSCLTSMHVAAQTGN